MISKYLKIVTACLLVVGMTSCDVNKFLEDVAEAMETPPSDGSTQPSDNGRTQSTNNGTKVVTRESTRSGSASTESSGSATEMDEIMAELNLSSQQITQYRAINKKYSDQMANVKASNKDNATKSRDMKVIRDAQNKELYDLLTPAQLEEYKRIKAERSGKMR